MIEIFVNNRKLDVDKGVSLNTTYSLSSLNNPAEIKSDYTKSISIPKTDKNKDIFGRLDRLDSTSKRYNASKRYDCEIRYNGDIVIKGYVKLEDITDTINITIFGQIGEFFKNLEDKKLVGLTSTFPNLDHKLNRDFIKENWEHENDINGESIHDYVCYGFGYNGIYDDFNNSYVQTDTYENNKDIKADNQSDKDKKIEEIIFTENPEDVDEHQMKLYMSYCQRRGFYVNKIIKSILDNSGYKFEYSPLFFNENNPYWKNTVAFFNKEKTIEKDALSFMITNKEYVVPQNGNLYDMISVKDKVPFDKLNAISKYLDEDGYLDMNKLDVAFSHLVGELDVDFIFDQFERDGDVELYPLNIVWFNLNGIQYREVDENDLDTIYFSTVFADAAKGSNGPGSSWEFVQTDINKVAALKRTVKTTDVVVVNNRFYAKMPYEGIMNDGKVSMNIETFKFQDYPYYSNIPCRIRLRINTFTLDFIDDLNLRSGVTMTANQILSNNTTQKDFLLSYLKMFDLHIVLDKYQKKGKILTRNEFYKDYKIDNWDKLLDHSKEINIVPLTFDTKYISYKYKEGKTNFDSNYKDVWDRLYGEARIDTGFEFKEEPLDAVKSLFSTPIIAQDRSWEFSGRWKRSSTRDDKVMMYSCKRNGNVRERIDNGIQLYFRNSLKPCVEYQITDDTVDMLKYDKYCHNWTFKDGKAGESWINGINKNTDDVIKYYYRQFSSINDDSNCSLDWRRPAEIYFEGSYPDNICLYDRFWSKYVEEKYNVDNKVLTAYFNLPVHYLLNFTFNRFIYLRGQYWQVSRIIDFDPSKTETVYIELIQVKNINDYTNSQEISWNP